MKALVVTYGHPNGKSAGDTVINGILSGLYEYKYEVDVIYLVDNNTSNKGGGIDYIVPYHIKNYKILSKYNRSFTKYHFILSEYIKVILSRKYDIIIAFHHESEVFIRQYIKHSIKKCIIMSDPIGSILWYSENNSSLFSNIKRYFKAIYNELLEIIYYRINYKNNHKLFIYGYNHAKWRSIMLGKLVQPIRPIMPVGIVKNTSINENVFYYGGSLDTTASKKAEKSIKYKLLPLLDKYFYGSSFELRIVGNISSQWVNTYKGFSKINFIGAVEDFEFELSKGKYFILPMKYPVGVRTRLCSALAAGCICIVQKSILNNMPELKSCKSVFFFNNINEIVDILDNCRDKDMSELSKTFYLNTYHYRSSIKNLINYG